LRDITRLPGHSISNRVPDLLSRAVLRVSVRPWPEGPWGGSEYRDSWAVWTINERSAARLKAWSLHLGICARHAWLRSRISQWFRTVNSRPDDRAE
jgi:hypothetical protein